MAGFEGETYPRVLGSGSKDGEAAAANAGRADKVGWPRRCKEHHSGAGG